jgi:hypothetical protein
VYSAVVIVMWIYEGRATLYKSKEMAVYCGCFQIHCCTGNKSSLDNFALISGFSFHNIPVCLFRTTMIAEDGNCHQGRIIT